MLWSVYGGQRTAQRSQLSPCRTWSGVMGTWPCEQMSKDEC